MHKTLSILILGGILLSQCAGVKPTARAKYQHPKPRQEVVRRMTVTAYCAGCKVCGTTHRTASGYPARGRVAAADRSVPFGTVIIVRGKKWVVRDRGGAIRGNRIDLLMPSHKAALKYGRQVERVTMVKVKILKMRRSEEWQHSQKQQDGEQKRR